MFKDSLEISLEVLHELIHCQSLANIGSLKYQQMSLVVLYVKHALKYFRNEKYLDVICSFVYKVTLIWNMSLYFNMRTQIKNYPSRIHIQAFIRGSSKNRWQKWSKYRCFSVVVFDRRERLRQERYWKSEKNATGVYPKVQESSWV